MPDQFTEVVAALKRAFDSRAEKEKDVRPARVVGRATDGRTLLLDLAGECVQADGSGGYEGQVVTQLPALQYRDGTTGVPVIPVRDSAQLLGVVSIDPPTFSRGASALEVMVTGFGFTPTTVFNFLLPASEAVHPGIEIVAANYIDAEHFQIFINVAADAQLVTLAPLAFDDPSRRF